MKMMTMTPKLKKRKSRAKMKMPLDNGCMPKNKKGYCIISKKFFDPEKGMNKGIDKKGISAYLGSIDIKYSEPAQYKKIVEWFQKFSIQLGNSARVRILQDIVSNAHYNGYGWTCIDDIQDAWKQATTASLLDSVANKFHKCTTLERFKYDKNAHKAQWKYKMENELMERSSRLFTLKETVTLWWVVLQGSVRDPSLMF
jgi:hypothetical protein